MSKQRFVTTSDCIIGLAIYLAIFVPILIIPFMFLMGHSKKEITHAQYESLLYDVRSYKTSHLLQSVMTEYMADGKITNQEHSHIYDIISRYKTDSIKTHIKLESQK